MKRLILFLIAAAMLLAGTANAMSYEEERVIARDFLALLEANNLIVYDAEITRPVEMITERLSEHIKSPVYDFKVHVVRDRSVNAFTTPDGHIFVNLGLLLFARDMDEVAAVIGHEMGHAQLRHIPENYDTQKTLNAATILGVLAGTLLSAKSPEAGAAMVFSSLGGTENIRLAYSRLNEFSADEYGKNLLQETTINPQAMPRFLIRLNTFSGTSGIPEYLLTHPFTENRVVNMRLDPGKPAPDASYWTLSACIAGLVLPASEAGMRSTSMPEPYRSLAMGLSQTRSGNHVQAIALLEKVDLSVAHAYRGVNLAALGRKDEAYVLLKDHATSARTRTALAEILAEKGLIDEAIATLLPYQGQNPRGDYTMGILYERAQKPAWSHAAFARYFFKTENYKASLHHIDTALKDKDALPQEQTDELTAMKDMIRKSQAGSRQ
jgi:predicted Zn-dependent protease